MEDRWTVYDRIVTIIEESHDCGECDYKRNLLRTIREDYRMSSTHKDVPEYDETVVCSNPECAHLEAPAITGLYGIAGGGGIGVYSVCEHCGTVLTKSVDPEVVCDTQNIGHTDLMVSPEAIDKATENVDVEVDTKPGSDDNK